MKAKAQVSLTPRPRTAAASRMDAGSGAPRRHGKLGQAFSSLNAVLKSHLRRSADGRKVISHATLADRSEFYSRMVRELHAMGYRILDIRQLKPKHVEALMQRWEAAGLSASTLQKRFSHLKVLCGWLGKASMLRAGASYLDDPERFQRRYEAGYDHSWTAQGVDPLDKIAEIAEDDPDVARVLRLQYAFGLRVQEASLLNPARDVLEPDGLRVVAGTKGGRPRAVPIETEAQRTLLREAENQARRTGHSMIPPHYDLKQWLTRCYTVLARHGVTRKHGLVTHGLRHQYANDRYEELTGEPSPVRGGVPVNARDDQAARQELTARLGHARPSITHAYYGRESVVGAAPPRSADEVKQQARELSVQKRLLAARLKDRIGTTTRRGLEAVSASTQGLRARLLNRMLADLLRLGVPLSTPDALSTSHVDALLRYWRQAALTADSQRQRVATAGPTLRMAGPARAGGPGAQRLESRGRGPAVPRERGAPSGTPPGDSGDRCARRLASGAGAGIRSHPPSGRGAATGHGRAATVSWTCSGKSPRIRSCVSPSPVGANRRCWERPAICYRTRRRRSARPNWRWRPGCAGSMTSCAPSAGSAFRVNRPCGNCRTVTLPHRKSCRGMLICWRVPG